MRQKKKNGYPIRARLRMFVNKFRLSVREFDENRSPGGFSPSFGQICAGMFAVSFLILLAIISCLVQLTKASAYSEKPGRPGRSGPPTHSEKDLVISRNIIPMDNGDNSGLHISGGGGYDLYRYDGDDRNDRNNGNDGSAGRTGSHGTTPGSSTSSGETILSRDDGIGMGTSSPRDDGGDETMSGGAQDRDGDGGGTGIVSASSGASIGPGALSSWTAATEKAAPDQLSILILGNSITMHEPADGKWWGSWGMAATSKETDYAHVMEKRLEAMGTDVSLSLLKLSDWEAPDDQPRSSCLQGIAPALAGHPDIVIVQLGENVSDTATFKEDLANLLSIVHAASPKSRILVMGNVLSDWSSPDVDTIKREVASAPEYEYIDMSDLLGRAEIQAGIGYMVKGDDGLDHMIGSQDVALHPNDIGMEMIAEKLVDAII